MIGFILYYMLVVIGIVALMYIVNSPRIDLNPSTQEYLSYTIM